MATKVWVMTETREGQPAQVRAFATREAAYTAGAKVIEDYRNNPRVGDEIDRILDVYRDDALDDHYAWGSGDASCFFYVEVNGLDLED